MRLRVLGVNAVKQPIAFLVRQLLGWRDGLVLFHQRMESSKKAIWTS
jgi:hypothetical protein